MKKRMTIWMLHLLSRILYLCIHIVNQSRKKKKNLLFVHIAKTYKRTRSLNWQKKLIFYDPTGRDVVHRFLFGWGDAGGYFSFQINL